MPYLHRTLNEANETLVVLEKFRELVKNGEELTEVGKEIVILLNNAMGPVYMRRLLDVDGKTVYSFITVDISNEYLPASLFKTEAEYKQANFEIDRVVKSFHAMNLGQLRTIKHRIDLELRKRDT